MNRNNVPMMFQAQIPGLGGLQVLSNKKDRSCTPKLNPNPATTWQSEWQQAIDPTSHNDANSKPKKKVYQDQSQTKFSLFANAFKQAGFDPDSLIDSLNIEVQQQRHEVPPQFSKYSSKYSKIQTQQYRVVWRLVTNSGQDDSLIRPIIGARGYPFFSGSSMKGAFRRACTPDQCQKYCGYKKQENGSPKFVPGSLSLRFHGGYSIDRSWTQDLIDLAHPQESWQVKTHDTRKKTGHANPVISLKNTVFEFGISSSNSDKIDWGEVWEIWDKAVARGLGSHTSSGYGTFEKVNINFDRSQQKQNQPWLTPKDEVFAEVFLSGTGVASKLLENQESEFRPNMFKAALRGHTLRLFGGLTNSQTAEYLTELLWGGLRQHRLTFAKCDRGFPNQPIVGLLGIKVSGNWSKCLDKKQHYTVRENNREISRTTSIYKIENICLKIVKNRSDDLSTEGFVGLDKIAQKLIQFAMLFGGFGKSWRRIDHQIFYRQYTHKKPTIGCHWKYGDESSKHYNQFTTLDKVRQFLVEIQEDLRQWAISQIEDFGNRVARDWRESWHPYLPRHPQDGGVLVYGREANTSTSKAISWFHKEGKDAKALKSNPILSGQLNQIGRIWHRMYPIEDKGYLEFLTIFPDNSATHKISKTARFLEFLNSENSGFTCIYGGIDR